VPTSRVSRHSYHHGDLANALTSAALDLARTGGPEAVVLREAARQIGVSATAAYRHFSSREALMHAVKDCALGEMVERMEQELERVPAGGDPATRLRARLRALGAGYIGFALEKPGLFRTAFQRNTPITGQHGADPMETAPFKMVIAILDDLVELGLIEPDKRPFLGMAAWATVHGMADLILDGPMRHMTPEIQQTAVDRALDMVVDGITVR
jgi:AcrR family transcriptional regulator